MIKQGLLYDYLNGSLCIKGWSKNDLFSATKEVDAHTRCVDIVPQDIIVYSVESVCKNGLNIMVADPNFMNVRDLFPIKINKSLYDAESGNYFLYKYEDMKKEGLSDTLIEEIKVVGYFLEYKETYIIPSTTFMATFCRQLGCSKLPDMSDPIREIFIAHLLRDANNFKMIYRVQNGVCKALACFTSSYVNLLQYDVVRELIDSLEEVFPQVLVNYFKISQNKTTIIFTFPEKAYIVKFDNKKKRICPGVIFTMSQCGDYSFSLQGYIAINGKGVVIDGLNSSHSGKFKISRLVKDYFEKKYMLVEQAIKRVIETDDSNSIDFKENFIKCLNAIYFSPAVGQKMYALIKETLVDRKCSSKELIVSLLDVAGLISGLAERNNKKCPESTVNRAEKQLGNLFTNRVVAEVLKWK